MRGAARVKFKVGDCIAAYNGIGKITDVVYNQDKAKFEFRVDLVSQAIGLDDEQFFGGIARSFILLSPLRANRYAPATEEEWEEAVALVEKYEGQFDKILSRIDKDKYKHKL